MKKIIIPITVALSLQGCIFVAGAAAGAAGVAVVNDHRSIQVVLHDRKIENAVADQIQSSPDLHNNSHIDVTSFHDTILLTGQVSTPELREQAESLAKTVPDVKRIYNELTVEGPSSSLTRASDSWITTKIKTQMLATENLKSTTIKVITEDGTVYLMGQVSPEQADMAVNIARQVSGVQKVIKIFEYPKEVKPVTEEQTGTTS